MRQRRKEGEHYSAAENIGLKIETKGLFLSNEK